MNTKQKVEAAEQRIKELQILIEHWKKQKWFYQELRWQLKIPLQYIGVMLDLFKGLVELT